MERRIRRLGGGTRCNRSPATAPRGIRLPAPDSAPRSKTTTAEGNAADAAKGTKPRTPSPSAALLGGVPAGLPPIEVEPEAPPAMPEPVSEAEVAAGWPTVFECVETVFQGKQQPAAGVAGKVHNRCLLPWATRRTKTA